jgi:hypothetical protein
VLFVAIPRRRPGPGLPVPIALSALGCFAGQFPQVFGLYHGSGMQYGVRDDVC